MHLLVKKLNTKKKPFNSTNQWVYTIIIPLCVCVCECLSTYILEHQQHCCVCVRNESESEVSACVCAGALSSTHSLKWFKVLMQWFCLIKEETKKRIKTKTLKFNLRGKKRTVWIVSFKGSGIYRWKNLKIRIDIHTKEHILQQWNRENETHTIHHVNVLFMQCSKTGDH